MVTILDNKNFHKYDRRLSLLLPRINPNKYASVECLRIDCRRRNFNLTKKNIELLDKYFVDITNEGLTKARILSVMDQTARILEFLNKDWESSSVDDIREVVNRIRCTDWGEHTKSDYLDKLKRFDKWNNDGEYSEKTRKIKTTMKNKYYKLPNQLITPDEAKKIINATSNVRDRAIISMLWETGARVGEIANIKVGDVEINKGECQVNLYGKTGSRRVLLLESTRDIKNYLQTRNNPKQDEFLFLLMGNRNHNAPITYSSVMRMMEDIRKRVELKKHIHPHLFRHSRASYLASKGLNEVILCNVFGWQIGSKQVRTYIHLSGAQVQSALREKVYGLQKNQEPENEFITCPTCGEINSKNSDTCKQCYNPLTIQGALKIKQEKEIIQYDRDISQKVFAEAFKLMTTCKELNAEQAQQQAIQLIAQQIKQEKGSG